MNTQAIEDEIEKKGWCDYYEKLAQDDGSPLLVHEIRGYYKKFGHKELSEFTTGLSLLVTQKLAGRSLRASKKPIKSSKYQSNAKSVRGFSKGLALVRVKNSHDDYDVEICIVTAEYWRLDKWHRHKYVGLDSIDFDPSSVAEILLKDFELSCLTDEYTRLCNSQRNSQRNS